MRTTSIAAYVLACSCFAWSGCGKDDASPSGKSGDSEPTTSDAPTAASTATTHFDVEWAEGTRVLDADFMGQHFIAVDDKANALRFSAEAAATFSELKRGDVLVLTDLGIVRVNQVSTADSGEQLLKVRAATLPEAIARGKISWDAPLLPSNTTEVQMQGVGVATQALTEPITLEKTIDGYDVKATFSPSAEALELALTVSREVKKTKIGLTAKGAFRTGRSRAEIEVFDGETTVYEQSLDQISGELELVGIGVDIPAFKKELKIPLSWTIPVRVGPVPVSIQIGVEARFLIEAVGVGVANSKFTFKYDSDLGFRLEGGAPAALKNIRSWLPTFEEADATSTTGVGVGVTVVYPHVKVSLYPDLASLLNSTAMADFKLEAYQYSLFNFNRACKEAKAKLEMRVGTDFTLLGVPIAKQEVSLAHETAEAEAGKACFE